MMKPSAKENSLPSMSQSGQHQLLVSTSKDGSAEDDFVKKYLQNPLKKLFTYSEMWFNMAFGTAMNPFYYLGSLAFFFLWVVLISGIYVYIFFDTGIHATYQSIEYITHEQWYLGGVMRSLHRYASDAAVIAVVVHILREFALDRFRGFRWFSWFTGMVPLWLMVMLGITGYWLVWDQVGQYVALSSAKLLDVLPFLGGGMARNFLGENINDRFFTLMTLLHLVGGPMGLIFALWIHVKRISNVSPMGPTGLAASSFLALLALALIKPAVSHAPADMLRIPTELDIDWFYLNAFPLLQYWSAEAVWALILGVTLLVSLLPWLPWRRTPAAATVQLDHCNGCGQCLEDCPYDAVSIRARSDGARWENEAVVNPDLCASCGICVGSCPSSNPFRRVDKQLTTGVDIPTNPVHGMHAAIKSALSTLSGAPVKILVYGCKHGVDATAINTPGVATITLSCTGMLPSGFVDYALKKGADGVVISGCRGSDCHYRFGNHWIEQRLQRKRMPSLRKKTDRGRIKICWAADIDGNKLLSEVECFYQRMLREKHQDAGKITIE